MTTVFAIANQKGGVAKTTTSVTMAAGLALAGFPTLLIDLDPQGNVSDSLGLGVGNELINLMDENQASRQVFIRTAIKGLFVVRSDKRTVNLKSNLAGRGFVEFSIKEALETTPGYKAIVIDCAPSVDVLHLAALVAADWLLVPSKLDQFAVKGLGEILTTLAAINKRNGGQGCQFAGILPTFYDKTTNETQIQFENLCKHFGSMVWQPIPTDTKVREANTAGKTLWEYCPNSRVITEGYKPALSRLIGLLKQGY